MDRNVALELGRLVAQARAVGVQSPPRTFEKSVLAVSREMGTCATYLVFIST